MGVMAPSHETPVRDKMYKEPEKINIPVKKSQKAVFNFLFGG